jgi:acetyl-CoA carboxylase biotin carboxylase subunit
MSSVTQARPFRRVFVANRGEIAVRIIGACRAMGLETVAAVSSADRCSLAASLADRAVCIGPPQASESYLKMEALVAAALSTGCDAVHPGYGFLSEREAFERMCTDHKLIFVGPPAAAMRALGDKLNARRVAASLGIRTVPGTDHVERVADALEFGDAAGYPFLFKASAGGGGRGMRIVRQPEDVAVAFESASAEARAAFGDPTLFIERYIEHARHVEVQILADSHRNVIHLGERDCSTQRRHQKLIEEAPCPVISESTRSRMCDAAVRLAAHVGYVNAGTVEFILDADCGDFYFLEVNARIQVEHPVTEMVTSLDLICEQLKIARGEELTFRQSEISTTGHAIECRINAEAPDRDFMPSPGRIDIWRPPSGPGIRIDSHCQPGYVVPPFYDSMLAKLIAHGKDRNEAIARLSAALASFEVRGPSTTIALHRSVVAHPDFRANRVTTRWVEETFMRSASNLPLQTVHVTAGA